MERKTETLGDLKIGKDKGFKIELVTWSLKQKERIEPAEIWGATERKQKA